MPSKTAGRRRHHRGGALEIKQEGDKWYIYVDKTKVSHGFDSFEQAKSIAHDVETAVTLAKLKKGGRRTRRHRRSHRGGLRTIKVEDGKFIVMEDGKEIASFGTMTEATRFSKQRAT